LVIQTKDSKPKQKRLIEKWEDIVNHLNLDLYREDIYYIKANQIKEITNREPRLMAKMDTLESVPFILRKTDRFLLPVSRNKYAILKGYHIPENIENKPMIHYSRVPFPKSALGTESESVFLDYANSCGLLEEFTKQNGLVQTMRNRTTTPEFSFFVNGSPISVHHAQIEIDACYENLNQIIIFEAKIGIPSSFNIRQLYYPFRKYLEHNKKIRSILFCLMPGEKIYSFWEYEFSRHDMFESIKLVKAAHYRILISKTISANNFKHIPKDNNLRKAGIPQADDVNKIIEFSVRVLEGYDNAESMRTVLGFVNRQSSYYRQAAEMLGLVEITEGYRYRLTEKGEKLVKLSGQARSSFVCKLLLQFPIINEIFLEISSDRNRAITSREIRDLIARNSGISGSTVMRRSRTIISWFKWIRNNLGIVDVDSSGTIKFAG
jgi:C-terminal AAA-associated domain